MNTRLFPHVVAQGEHLAKIAFARGFDADAVWNDPKNEEIRALRKDPLVLAPGDIVHIPAPARRALPISMGAKNRYVAKVPRIDVHLVLHEDDGRPLADEPYVVEGLGESEAAERRTMRDGSLSFEAPVHVREVTLLFPRRHMRLAVKVGDMDPLEETSGVAARLANISALAATIGGRSVRGGISHGAEGAWHIGEIRRMGRPSTTSWKSSHQGGKNPCVSASRCILVKSRMAI